MLKTIVKVWFWAMILAAIFAACWYYAAAQLMVYLTGIPCAGAIWLMCRDIFGGM